MSTSSSQVQPIDLDGLNLPAELIARVPAVVAYDYRIIPVRLEADVLTVATADASDLHAMFLDDLRFQLRFARHVLPMLTTTGDIDAALRRYYPGGRGHDGDGASASY
jgi:hypothetical protein